MKFVSLIALTLAVAVWNTEAAVLPRDYSVLKERVSIPRGWVKRSAIADSTPATFRLGLARRGISEIEAKIQDISDPDSKNYAQWLTKPEVDSLAAPSAHARAAVNDWLESHGISEELARRSPAGDYITVRTTYGKARDLLGSQFHTYQHRKTGEVVVRTEEIHLPRSVSDHIDVVYPSTNFGRPQQKASTIHVNGIYKDVKLDAQLTENGAKGSLTEDGAPSSCRLDFTTLQCIQELYKTPNGTLKAERGATSFAIGGFLEEYANYQDYQTYKQRLAPYALDYSFATEELNGGTNNQSIAAAGGEADLDVQAALLAYPIPLTYYSVGGRGDWVKTKSTPTNSNEPYAAFLEHLLTLSDDELPQVVSHSYDDDEFSVAPSYAQRVCQDILLITVRGTTALFSSGDDGVGGDCEVHGKKKYIPEFPSTCPWALSVGATERYAPEVAVSSDVGGFYSGGGFSNVFPRPWYQKEAVDPYVAKLDSRLKPYYNASGRGVPDVSAQGSSYLIRVAGQWAGIGGTSASTPTFSAVLALLNDRRAAKGIPSLGFINPLLYKRGQEGLNDILSGSSAGCPELGAPANQGFPAAKGWDAVTGLGTPDFPKLEKIFTFEK